MMWLEFLFDRIGGSEVFQNIFDGKANALVRSVRHSRH